MRTCCCIAALGFVAFLIPVCGAANGPETAERHQDAQSEVQSLEVTLSGWRGPESAGLLMAAEHGYFAEEGLEVSILSPSTPERPVEYVVNETDDIGVSHMPEVVLAKERGEPIVAIGSLIPEATAALIWLQGSNIQDVADLKGKTIAVPGVPFQADLLRNLLERVGLTLDDVTLEKVGYDLVSSLASGSADAIFGGSGNWEGVELESRGLKPVIARVGDYGIPPYEELVFIARTDRVEREPQTFRDFMSSLRRGTTAAVNDPEEAARLLDSSVEVNPETTPLEMEEALEATLPLLSRTGYMNPALAHDLVDWMHQQGIIRTEPPVGKLLTNRYLELEGLHLQQLLDPIASVLAAVARLAVAAERG